MVEKDVKEGIRIRFEVACGWMRTSAGYVQLGLVLLTGRGEKDEQEAVRVVPACCG